jgi:hypothetical protein
VELEDVSGWGLRTSRGTDDLSGFGGVFGLRRRRAICSVPKGPSGCGGGEQIIWFHRYFGFGEADGEHAGDGVVFGPRRGRRGRPEQRGLSGSCAMNDSSGEKRASALDDLIAASVFSKRDFGLDGERVESFEPGHRPSGRGTGGRRVRATKNLRVGGGAGRCSQDRAFGRGAGGQLNGTTDPSGVRRTEERVSPFGWA